MSYDLCSVRKLHLFLTSVFIHVFRENNDALVFLSLTLTFISDLCRAQQFVEEIRNTMVIFVWVFLGVFLHDVAFYILL